MSYNLNKDWSLDSLQGYVDDKEAALAAMDETAPLAGTFNTRHAQLGEAIKKRETLRRNLRRSAARLRVRDAQWDAAITTLSGHAHLAAAKNEQAEPYLSLFGSISAKAACAFGMDRATTVGKALLKRANELNHPALADHVAAFSRAQTALLAAVADYTAADDALVTLDVERRRLIREVQEEVAQAEVGILTRFPGRKDLVRALLAPDKDGDSPRRKTDGGTGEDPADAG